MLTYSKEQFNHREHGGHPIREHPGREKWNNNPKHGVVEKMPIQLDLWAVDACNLKCPMCPRTLGNASNKIMRVELIEKLFDEISNNKLYALNLGGLGEPTMLPNFNKYVNILIHSDEICQYLNAF